MAVSADHVIKCVRELLTFGIFSFSPHRRSSEVKRLHSFIALSVVHTMNFSDDAESKPARSQPMLSGKPHSYSG
jgi:hypothetical protein